MIRSISRAEAIAALIVMSGCRSPSSTGLWGRAELTTKGELIVFHLQYPPTYKVKLAPVSIDQEYAFLVGWSDTPSERRFIVYDRPGRRVSVTRDFRQFLQALNELPHGVTVGWVNTCFVPISYGLGNEREAQIRAALAAGNRRLLTSVDEGSFLCKCTCESTRILLPGDPLPPAQAQGTEGTP